MQFFSSISPALPIPGIRKASRGRGLHALACPALPDAPTSPSRTCQISTFRVVRVRRSARTPRPVIDKIADAVNSTVKHPQIATQFSSARIVVSVMTPEELASFVQEEAKKYARIINQAGVEIE